MRRGPGAGLEELRGKEAVEAKSREIYGIFEDSFPMSDSLPLLSSAFVTDANAFITRLLGRALRDRVDDLVIEPMSEGYRVLESYADAAKVREVHRGPGSEYEAIRDVFKGLSGMVLDVRDARQRGDFQFPTAAGRVGIRVMSDPGSTGEWLHIAFETSRPTPLLLASA